MPVVWAEDAEGDQFLIRSALEAVPGAPRIRFTPDGAQVLDEVKRHRPRLVVLDINMPNVDGIEALRRLRAQPELSDLPVVMFSTARNDDELKVCEGLGIKAFVQKPVQFDEFSKAVRGIIDLAA
jgi:two-component system response regulator